MAVAPLSVLGATTTKVTALPAPAQRAVAAQVTTTTLSPAQLVNVLRPLATKPIVHPVVVHRVVTRVVHHVFHHVVTFHRPVIHRPVVSHPIPSYPGRSRVGIATWYSWHPGQCATSYRPHGTRIWVRDLATGRVITCLVTDSQPYSPSRVVDLSETSFAELAPLAQGVIRVKVTW